jgi:hypothetical protein
MKLYPPRSVRTAVRSELTGITPKTAAGTAQTVPTIEGFPGTETQPRGGGKAMHDIVDNSKNVKGEEQPALPFEPTEEELSSNDIEELLRPKTLVVLLWDSMTEPQQVEAVREIGTETVWSILVKAL